MREPDLEEGVDKRMRIRKGFATLTEGEVRTEVATVECPCYWLF
jgi:hypothetical protein